VDPGEILGEAQIAAAAQIAVRSGLVKAHAIRPFDSVLDVPRRSHPLIVSRAIKIAGGNLPPAIQRTDDY
jgi:hypothetical protein